MRQLGSIKDSITRASQLLAESRDKSTQGTIFVISSSTQLAQLNPANSVKSVRIVPINLTAGLSIDNAAIVGVTAGRAPELGNDYWEVSVEPIILEPKKRRRI